MSNEATKIYWKNFLTVFGLIAFTTAFLSFFEGGYTTYPYNLLLGIVFVYVFLVFYTCHKIALSFVHSQRINEYIKDNNMTMEEFHKKYDDFIDYVYRK